MPAYEAAPHGRDDAEAAFVVAAFRNFQIGVMARCQAYALWRNEVGEWVMKWRQMLMHRADHFFIRMGSRHLEHAWMSLENSLGLGPKTSGHDDSAVLLEGLTNGVKGLVDCRVDESARVDYHDVGSLIRRRYLVALRSKVGEDAFRVNERFGAP